MTRAHVALATLAAAAGGIAVLFTWQPSLASLYDDSVSYLLIAQAYSPFLDASPAVAAAAALEKYPPLFPLLLAWTGGAGDWRIAHAVVAIAFAASVFLLGVLAARITRSHAMGLAAALVYAAMPGAWLNVKGILTEYPFMALAFAALAYHHGLREATPTLRSASALGALLAAAFLTRTIGFTLMLAIAAAEVLRFARERDRARLARMGVACAWMVLAAAAWYALRPAGGEDAYAAYSTRMATGGADQAAFIVQANASALLDAWLNALLIFWGEPWRPGFLLAAFLGAGGLAAAAWRAWRGEADGLFVVFFLAVLLFWPFPGQMFRLAWPVVPLLWVAVLAAWSALAARWPPERAARAPLVAILPLVLCVPASLFYVVERAHAAPAASRIGEIAEFYRIPSGPAAASNALAQLAVMDDLERVRKSTPEHARVMWYAPAYVALLAGRQGVGLDPATDAAAFARMAREAQADYIYLGPLHPRDSAMRLGDPLAPRLMAQGFTDPVWQRADSAGRVRSVLLKVRPQPSHNSAPR